MTFFLYGTFLLFMEALVFGGIPIFVFDHLFDLHCTNHDFVARCGLWYLTVTCQSFVAMNVSGFSC